MNKEEQTLKPRRKLRPEIKVFLGFLVISPIAIAFILLAISNRSLQQQQLLSQETSNNPVPVALTDTSTSTESQSSSSSSTSSTQKLEKIQLHGWIPYWDQELALNTLESNPDVFTSLSPAWYTFETDGTLLVKGGYNNDLILSTITEESIPIIPSISNSSATELSVILNDPELLNTHIDEIVSFVVSNNFDGVDIDYEEINGSDREAFSSFIKELATRLHNHDKLLSIAILWKNEPVDVLEAFSKSRQAQNWEEIGKHVDQFRIMAYDYTHSYNSAGPIAPAKWLEEVIVYAVSVIDAKKIVLGLPLYAYDWQQDVRGGARALLWQDVKGIRNNTALGPIHGFDQGENTLTYTEGGIPRIIYFQDANVTKTRIELARNYGIYQFAFWKIGGEDPNTWNILKTL